MGVLQPAMQNTLGVHDPCTLSDEELVTEVQRRAGNERASTADLLVLLAELDSRKLYLGAGYSSLFVYCCEVLRLSEHGTYNRIEAARAARKFPVLLDLLRDGALNLATVRLLAPHLTADNHRELLDAASGLSKRDVERLLAERFPQPDLPAIVRKLPVVRALVPPATPALADKSESKLVAPDSTTIPARTPRVALPPPRRPVVAPLAPDRYLISFTASAQTRDKLRRAQELLRHSIPSGDPAEIVDRALTLLLEAVAREKLAATPKPRPSRVGAADSRHVSASVTRAVWARDGERCTFVGRENRRCTERSFLELHHRKPYGAGGAPTVENLAVRCRSHNQYEADLFYSPSRDADATRPGASSHKRGAGAPASRIPVQTHGPSE
jgi:hypothetical protein